MRFNDGFENLYFNFSRVHTSNRFCQICSGVVHCVNDLSRVSTSNGRRIGSMEGIKRCTLREVLLHAIKHRGFFVLPSATYLLLGFEFVLQTCTCRVDWAKASRCRT